MKKLKYLITIFLLLPSFIFASVTVDSQESGGTAHRGTTSGTALSFSFNNAGGNLLVCSITSTVSAGATPVVTVAPTYNSVAMTQAGSNLTWDTSRVLHAVYYLTNPATGAKTFSVTTTGGTSYAVLAGCISFAGVDTTNPVGTPTTATVTSAATVSSAAITAANGNYVYASGSWGSGLGGTAGAGFTRTFLTNGSGSSGGDNILGEDQLSSGASITPALSWTNNDFGGIIGVEIKASSATAAVPKVIVQGQVIVKGQVNI